MIAENKVHLLKYKTPFFPYVTLFGIWVQVICLGVIAFTADLRSTLYAGIPMLVVPMLWYRVHRSKNIHEAATAQKQG